MDLPADFDTAIAFEAKAPYHTCRLAIARQETPAAVARVAALLPDLRACGWAPPAIGTRELPPPPPRMDGTGRPAVMEVVLTRPGTALFGGWTDDERKRFLAEARAVLRRHGFPRIPLHRLAPGDD